MSAAEKGLEPCPCGGVRDWPMPEINWQGLSYAAECQACGRRGPGYTTPHGAAATWNRMALSAEAFALLERVTKQTEQEAAQRSVNAGLGASEWGACAPKWHTDARALLARVAPEPETNTEETR